MTDNELKRLVTDSELKRLVEATMQADLQANGPVPDDPKEALMRGIESGIEAAMLIIGG